MIVEKYNRDTTLLFYDVTNYYFEIDDFRRKGVGKDKRIVNSSNGIVYGWSRHSINYQLSRNTNDCKTLIPMMGPTRLDLYTNVIIVGDKGWWLRKH